MPRLLLILLATLLLLACGASVLAYIEAQSSPAGTSGQDVFTPLVGIASALFGGLIGTLSSWWLAERANRKSQYAQIVNLIGALDSYVMFRRRVRTYVAEANTGGPSPTLLAMRNESAETAISLVPQVESLFRLVGDVRGPKTMAALREAQEQFERLRTAAMSDLQLPDIDTTELDEAAKAELQS